MLILLLLNIYLIDKQAHFGNNLLIQNSKELTISFS